MSSRKPRTTPCTRETAAGRLRKAQQFMATAQDARELAEPDGAGDALVTLYVHAGIAAADVLCCRYHGEHARGDDHREAVGLLAAIEPDGRALSNQLDRLLGMKTKAAYTATPVSDDDVRLAERAAKRLIEAAVQAGVDARERR